VTLSGKYFVCERSTSGGFHALIIVPQVISDLREFNLQGLIVSLNGRLRKTDLMKRSFACRIADAKSVRSLQTGDGLNQIIQPGNAAGDYSPAVLGHGKSSAG